MFRDFFRVYTFLVAVILPCRPKRMQPSIRIRTALAPTVRCIGRVLLNFLQKQQRVISVQLPLPFHANLLRLSCIWVSDDRWSGSRYTSIGSIHNTVPNELLRDGSGGYRPAYTLSDGGLERAGRAKKAGKKNDSVINGRNNNEPRQRSRL